jgi:hypothetical protein
MEIVLSLVELCVWILLTSALCGLPIVVKGRPGVADPVKPCYNHSMFPSFFERSQIPDNLFDLAELSERGVFGYHSMCMLSNTQYPFHKVNKLFVGYDADEITTLPNFLNGTTYWLNEYMHVGHVHYDIGLLQVLATTKLDRIVVQRAVCHEKLCHGIGPIESFYKGYFTAALEAFNQSHVPVYLRYHPQDTEWLPVYFSSHSPTMFLPRPDAAAIASLVPNSSEELKWRPLPVSSSFFFQTMIRRGEYHFGGIPSVSKRAVQLFKAAAYRSLRHNNHTAHLAPLTTEFTSLDPPYAILFAFRGPRAASRRIENQATLVERLQRLFAPPRYELRLLNTSDPDLDFETQLHAVASAHVVLTNHGAFEGNMIFMRNSSLLIEVFGDYGNNEIHTFHRLALMFGFFYARVQPRNNTHHLAPSFVLFDDEIQEITDMIQDFFDNQRFRPNVLV